MLAVSAVKGAGWLVFSRIVGRIIDFISLLILARLLQPADFGLVALAMALIVVVDIVLEIPVLQALVRLPSIERADLDAGFTLGVLRSFAIAALILAAMYPYSKIKDDPSLIPVIAAMSFGPIVKGFASPAMVYYIRAVDFRPTCLMEITSKLCAFLVALVIVSGGGSYWAIVGNYVANSLIAMLLSHVLAPYRPRLCFARLAEFAGFIGWFSSAQLISALNWQFDRFLVGAFQPNAVLGQYALANDVAVIPTQSIIGPAMQPVMAAFAKINSDDDRMKMALSKATRFAMLITVPVCLGISTTADLITAILLGPQWAEAAIYLRLLALSVLPIPYFQTLYSANVSIGRPEEIFRLNLIDFCGRVVLVSAGFFLFSVIGACVARMMLSSGMFALYLHQARRIFRLGLRSQLLNIWKIGCSGGVMALVILSFRTQVQELAVGSLYEFAASVVVGAVAYGVSLLLLGVRLHLGPGRLDLVDKW